MTPTFHLRLKRQDGKKDGKLTWTLPEFGVVLEGDTEQELQEQANIFLGGPCQVQEGIWFGHLSEVPRLKRH